jgi:amino acid efflux transporter
MVEHRRRGARLGRIHGIALYSGAVLGSGVLLIPGVAAELAGPASLVAWGAMALAMLPLALTMATLAARFPGGGGVSLFARRAFGSVAEPVAGWVFLLAVAIGGPVAALIAVRYAVAAFGLPPAAELPLAVSILGVALVSNALGARTAGWLQVAVVAGIATILLLAISAAIPHVRAEQFTPFLPHGWVGVGRAAALLFWCFIGWEAVAHLSGEFGDPRRDLVPAVLWAVVLVGGLYFGAAFVTIGTGSYGGVKSGAPLVLVVRSALGPVAGYVVGTIAVACVIATANAYVGATAQLARALAREGLAPRFLAASTPRQDTPVGGLVFLACSWAFVFALEQMGVLSVYLLLALPDGNFIVTYILGSAAGIRLADTRTARILAGLALVTSAAVLPFLGWPALYALGAAGAGIVFWALRRRRIGREALDSRCQPDPKDGASAPYAATPVET